MVVKSFIFETLSGDLITEFEPKALPWSEAANQAETINATISLKAASEAVRDWGNLGTPWKHSIAVNAHGRFLGGPIMPHDFDDAQGELQVTSRGLRVAFARRSILPVAAMSQSLILPTGEPDPTLDSTWSNLDPGTIAKKIGQQACSWPGSGYPIVWPDDRPGTDEQTYPAVDLKKVDDAWSDLSSVKNGPDIRLRLDQNGPDRFQWFFETGTKEHPRLQGPDVFDWEIGQASGIKVRKNPTRMGSVSWSTGGRSSDTALVRMGYDPFLIDRGFPLLELESAASSTTDKVETLDSWNAETLRTARKPWEFWSFNVRADVPPFPYEYGIGSLINVHVTKHTPVRGGYIPPGVYQRRIAALSGDLGNTITITCGEVYDS